MVVGLMSRRRVGVSHVGAERAEDTLELRWSGAEICGNRLADECVGHIYREKLSGGWLFQIGE